MTSRCHGAKKLCSKQSAKQTKMASLSIASLSLFFAGEQKSLSRGENHYQSGHIESFVYDQRVIRGQVKASMKKKSYKVTVSSRSHVRSMHDTCSLSIVIVLLLCMKKK